MALLVGVVAMPTIAEAQECHPLDAAGNTCFIAPTPTQATVTAANVGVNGGTTPIVASVRYLGGVALFQDDVYFFQGFFRTGFNPLNPLLVATDFTVIGGKPYGSSIVNGPTDSPWITLPGTFQSWQELVFGIRVRGDGPADRWYYSGYGAYGYDRNSLGRNSQPGGPAFSPIYSNLFLNGAAPNSDGDPTNGYLRQGSPVAWLGAWTPGNGANSLSQVDALLGFEDNQGYSDGDFNDSVIALDFNTVPEPSSVALVAVGLVAMGAMARRRTRRE